MPEQSGLTDQSRNTLRNATMAHGLNDLAAFLMSAPKAEFRTQPYYEQHTDSLLTYLRDEPSFSVRLNNRVTLFLANKDRSLVGCEIKGVKRLLEISKRFALGVFDHKIKLGVIIALALANEPEDPSLEEEYEDSFEPFREMECPEDLLCPT